MVTADRPRFCRRAVRCYLRQTYANKELVVLDDGTADLEPILADVPASELTYIRIPQERENVLGRLRNIALSHTSGEYIAQWDDDDWYHPERLEHQVAVLAAGYEACSLQGTLMHLDTEAYFRHPYVGLLKHGIPGSIVHRRSESVRYPEVGRGEDTVFLHQWKRARYHTLSPAYVHLYIRCFHGNNTWDIDHFLRRLRNTFPDLLLYGWHAFIRKDLFAHPRFQLDPEALKTFRMYVEDSLELGIFPTR